jgi:hypothetical protein
LASQIVPFVFWEISNNFCNIERKLMRQLPDFEVFEAGEFHGPVCLVLLMIESATGIERFTLEFIPSGWKCRLRYEASEAREASPRISLIHNGIGTKQQIALHLHIYTRVYVRY